MQATINSDLDITLNGVYQTDAGYIARRMDN